MWDQAGDVGLALGGAQNVEELISYTSIEWLKPRQSVSFPPATEKRDKGLGPMRLAGRT
jgi:hypothetical protein